MVETIKIKSGKHPQGWVLINLSDFVPSEHEKWTKASTEEPVQDKVSRGPGRPKRA